MTPLAWVACDIDRDVLERELHSLADHLEVKLTQMLVAGASLDDANAFVQSLRSSMLSSAELLVQSFMPAVEILKLALTMQGRQSVGIFLRQRISPSLPALWPLLDYADNLYQFLEGLPGVLDMTPDAVLGYGIFFANEAVVGDEGPFAAYPDFASLPQPIREAAVRDLPKLREIVASRPEAANAEELNDGALQTRGLRHVEAATAGSEPTGFSRLSYDPDEDDYCFDVFFVYSSALYAATIRVNRKTGRPIMTGDAPLAVIEQDVTNGNGQRTSRLPQIDLGGFTLRPPSIGPGASVQVPMRAISGVEAAEILIKTGELENARVAGDVTLATSPELASLRLQNCVIDGRLDLQNVSIRGALRLEDCAITGTVNLAGARIRRLVSITALEAFEIKAEGLRTARGSIAIGPLTLAGDLDLSGAWSRGSVSVVDSHIGGACRLTYLHAGSIEIGRGLSGATFIGKELDLNGCNAGGDIVLEGVHAGGPVSMVMGSVGGLFRIGAPHGEDRYRDRDTTIGQDLSFANSEIKGPLTLRGIHLLGSLRLELCRVGAIVAEGRVVCDRRDRRTTLLPSTIGGWVQIVACEIRGPLRLSALCVNKNYGAHYAIEVVSSTIGQGVTFWDEQLSELRSADDIAAYLGPASRTATAERVGWLFERSASPLPRGGWPIVWDETSDEEKLGGGGVGDRAADDISFRELRANLSAQHVTTTVDGDVRIALCKIGGDLSLTNLRAAGQRLVLEGLDIDGDLLADWTGRRYTDAHSSPPDSWLQSYVGLLNTTAAILVVDGARVGGEARLTGLRLTGRRTDGSGTTALRFVSSTVERVVRLTDLHTDRSAPVDVRSRATLNGDLNVSWSNIGHLVLDGRSMGMPSTDPSRRPNRFVAGNATIRKLELVDPPPGEIDLLDANVTFWDFGDDEAEKLLPFFHNVLDNQQPFRRNVYQEVEGYLHNIGHEDYAKAVRREMVAREHREALRRAWNDRWSVRGLMKTAGAALRSVGSWLNRYMTGNLTSEWRPLLFCWLPLWILASLYFREPARIAVVADSGIGAATTSAATCATLEHWNFWDSMKFSTRYVLPIVPSVGMEDLAAGDQLQSHASCGGLVQQAQVSGRHPLFRPSTVATFVRVLSWLFLSLTTGTIFAKMSRTPRASH